LDINLNSTRLNSQVVCTFSDLAAAFIVSALRVEFQALRLTIDGSTTWRSHRQLAVFELRTLITHRLLSDLATSLVNDWAATGHGEVLSTCNRRGSPRPNASPVNTRRAWVTNLYETTDHRVSLSLNADASWPLSAAAADWDDLCRSAV